MEHWRRSGEELLRALALHEERIRREYAASLELIAELTTRNVTAEVGYPSLAGRNQVVMATHGSPTNH